jgi:hypothetical protein
MNPNDVCNNSPNYQGTAYFTALGCSNQQLPIAKAPCAADSDCPLEQDNKTHLSCVKTGGGLAGHCDASCTQSSQCPNTMSCSNGTCVFGTQASAPYSDLYGGTSYNQYSCYSPPGYPLQCQGCVKWSDFGTASVYPGNPLNYAQAACYATNISFSLPAGTGQSYSNYATIYKTACPSAYSTQFDDKTSTFICGQPPQYVLTFCPDNALN